MTDVLNALNAALGPNDGRKVAEAWKAAFVGHPAIAANLRSLADAPTVRQPEQPLDALALAHQAGARDLALALLTMMDANGDTLDEIFSRQDQPYDR